MELSPGRAIAHGDSQTLSGYQDAVSWATKQLIALIRQDSECFTMSAALCYAHKAMLRAGALSPAVHGGASDGRRASARHHGEGRHWRPAANRERLRHAGDALLRFVLSKPSFMVSTPAMAQKSILVEVSVLSLPAFAASKAFQGGG